MRARDPSIPIVDYVSPSVWAWRPGRARAMRAYVDHVLALLPFEPEEYRRLRGPPCSYVGHPLTEQIGTLRPSVDEQKRRDDAPPVLLVLPGSRRSEIRHHMAVFGETLERLQRRGRGVRSRASHHAASAGSGRRGRAELEDRAQDRDRRAGKARGVPDRARGARQVRHRDAGACHRRRADGHGLPGRRGGGLDHAAPDRGEVGHPGQSRDRRECRAGILQQDCTPEKLSRALREVLDDTPMRRRQLEAFARIDGIMSTGNQPPSVRAADIVLATMRKARRPG